MIIRVLSTLILVLAAVCARAQGYVIDLFDARLNLAADGGLHVTETIDVTFSEPRHGIYRFVPVRYDNGKGTTRVLFLSGIRVTDGSGQKLTTKVTNDGPNLRIRVGDADITLPPGTRARYVFDYDVRGAINWFGDDGAWGAQAELYWNLTGNEWDTSITKTTYSLQFPKVSDKQTARARLFYGPYGGTTHLEADLGPGMDQSNTGRETSDGAHSLSLGADQVSGSLTEPLGPGSGATIVLGVPAELIAEPSFFQSAMMFVLPNLGFGIPLVMLGGMFLMWWKFGRDPTDGPMVVQFEPPDGMSGPEVGTLMDERVDSRDLAAGIVSLAVKGYLDIYPKEEGLIFKRRTAELEVRDKEASATLSIFETQLLSKLKKITGRIDDSDLRSSVAPYIASLRSSLYDCLVGRGYYLMSPEKARQAWTVGGLVVVVALAVIAVAINPMRQPLPSVVGGILGGLIVLAYSGAMPRRTPAGSKARAMVRGFEEFIRRARGDELEWKSKKHPDAVLFEEYLPHAVAFGLTAEWARAFEGLVMEPPSWYHSPYGFPYSMHGFGSEFDGITQAVSSAASTPPRSSGASGGGSGFSSGGGFSGGGFGGGGGGSW